jgi:hypothetical protein
MRWIPPSLVLLLCCLAAGPATAGDETSPPAAEPAAPAADPKPPLYSIEYLMPEEDDTLEGWSWKASAHPSGAPTESGLDALGKACGLDMDTFYVQTTALERKDPSAVVGVAMIDVEKHVAAFRAKLDEKAAASNWSVQALGSPTRLLVVGGGTTDAREAGAEAAFRHVVYKMASRAMQRLQGRAGHEKASQEAAREYSDAINRMARDSGVAHAILGVIHWLNSWPTKPGDKKRNKEELDKSSHEFDLSLASGVRYPPRKSLLVFVAGQLGGWLLEKKDKSLLGHAVDVLKRAVEHEAEGHRQDLRLQNRYNLACAYARMDRKNDALDALEGAMGVAKLMPAAAWRNFYKQVEKDTDMGPLHGEARYAKIMSDAKPPAPKNPHANPHGNPHGDPHHPGK